MNNFNPMNAPRRAREIFAAALDAEFQNLTASSARNYLSPLEINRLFNRLGEQNLPLQSYIKLLVQAAVEQQRQIPQ